MSRRRPIPKTDPARAVAYIRVSTDEQRLGPEAQRSAIESWAAARDICIVEWCEDLGVSGGAPIEKSPGLLRALNALEQLAAGILVVQKRDRLARDVIRAAVLETTAEKAGARIATTEDNESGTDDPSAWLLRTLKDAFSQFERLQIAARTRAALWKSGTPIGTPCRVTSRDME